MMHSKIEKAKRVKQKVSGKIFTLSNVSRNVLVFLVIWVYHFFLMWNNIES